MAKPCSKCGKTDSPIGKGRTDCRRCRNEIQREYRRNRREARTDPTLHDYGKKNLPPGYGLDAVSQLIDNETGEAKITWYKSKADKTKQTEILMDAMRDMLEEYTGIVDPVEMPENCTEDLCTVVPLGDPHIGLHCWHEETGNDFDLKIAAANMQTAVHELFATAPPAKQCVIINLGDYFHADNAKNTTTLGTDVDIDGRRVKVVRVGLDIFTDVIDTALLKHEQVHVICVTGNHDGDSSKMLAIMLDKMYAREPRVTIETAPTKFHRFRWGKCLFGATHGDTGKDVDLGMIMAVDWKEDWNAAEYYHWYKGHVHHDSLKEMTGGVIVETFRTLAPADAWHAGQGYRSGRTLKLDVWHKEWGHENRYEIGIRKIMELQR